LIAKHKAGKSSRWIPRAIGCGSPAEFRDDLVTAFPFFLFALSLELDEVLGSSLIASGYPCGEYHVARGRCRAAGKRGRAAPADGERQNRDEKKGK
jgi:hypothetical protein